jgi:hypothetical protein
MLMRNYGRHDSPCIDAHRPRIRRVSFVRSHLRRGAWLALFAIFALALLPAVSQALVASSPQAPWSEICSAGGEAHTVAAGEDSVPSAAHLQHCPLCSLGAAPLLPVPPVVLAHVRTREQPAAATLPAPTAHHAWAGVRARAPPLHLLIVA